MKKRTLLILGLLSFAFPILFSLSIGGFSFFAVLLVYMTPVLSLFTFGTSLYFFHKKEEYSIIGLIASAASLFFCVALFLWSTMSVIC